MNSRRWTIGLLLVAGMAWAQGPGAPTLTAPAAGETGVAVSPELDWNPVNGATRYGAQVATDQAFTAIVFSRKPTSAPSVFAGPLSAGRRYCWRARAGTDAGWGPWSEVRWFTTTGGVLKVPAPQAPPNGAAGMQMPIVMSWAAVPDAKNYTLQISRDATFANLLSNRDLGSNTIELSALTVGAQYWWRVRGGDGTVWSAWSPAWSFTVAVPVKAPAAVQLTVPPDGTPALALTTALGWQAIAGVGGYEVQLDTDQHFNTPKIDKNGLTAPSFAPDKPLAPNTVYYWRARAISAKPAGGKEGLWGPWSPTWSFTTEGLAPAPVSPPDGAADIPPAAPLEWTKVGGAITYAVQVARDTNFTNVSQARDNLTDPQMTTTALLPGTRYWWHARALTPTGPGAWSPTCSFTTRTLASPALTAPDDGAKDTPTSPAFTWNAVPTASAYIIVIAHDNTFTNTATQRTVTTPGVNVIHLTSRSGYFWRVRATNAAGQGPWSDTRAFTTAPLAAPTPTAPDDGASNAPLTQQVSWKAVPDVTAYALQVSAKQDFSSLLINLDNLTATAANLDALQRGTGYWWRVRAGDGTYWSDWSPIRGFTTAGLMAPTLTSPANGATGILPNGAGNPPSLTWQAVTAATVYAVQVAGDPGFTALVFSRPDVTGTTAPAPGLERGVTYYWRARAGDGATWSAWSDAWSFSTKPLEAPTLADPADTADTVPLAVRLTWQAIPEATVYSAQLANDNTFANPLLARDDLTTPQATAALQPGGTYYWRVRAGIPTGGGNGLRWSNWSAVRSFTTITLAPPVMSAPADGAGGLTPAVTAKWTASPGAAVYTVQVARDLGFRDMLAARSDLTGGSYDIPGLLRAAKYFWRMRAGDGKSWGAWSPVFSFTVATLAPPASVSAKPADGATNQPTDFTLSWTRCPARRYTSAWYGSSKGTP